MIILKSREEIEKMRASSRIVAEILQGLKEMVKPGVRTIDLDRYAEEQALRRGAKPAFKGYRGYEHALCTSVNNVVVHGIPSARVLEAGDILSLDFGVYYDGFYGDAALTVPVDGVSENAARLMKVTEEALYRGIEQAKVGNRLGDIAAAIQRHVEAAGFSVVRDYVGHGIGKQLHE